MLPVFHKMHIVVHLTKFLKFKFVNHKFELTCQYPMSIMGYWHQRADERHGNPPQR